MTLCNLCGVSVTYEKGNSCNSVMVTYGDRYRIFDPKSKDLKLKITRWVKTFKKLPCAREALAESIFTTITSLE